MNKYNIELNEEEFFILLNSLYHKREEIKEKDKIQKVIDKFDNIYFNEK